MAHLKLQVFFRKRATNYRALLRKMTLKDKAFYASTLGRCIVHFFSCRVRDVYGDTPVLLVGFVIFRRVIEFVKLRDDCIYVLCHTYFLPIEFVMSIVIHIFSSDLVHYISKSHRV